MPSKNKWVQQHQQYFLRAPRRRPATACLGVPKRCPSADQMLLTNPRQRHAWELVRKQHPGADLVVDVSQGIGRQLSLTGLLPTLTPRAEVAVAALGRVMLAEEKLMAMGFPIHKMYRPAGFSDAALSSLGGNSMHVQCVAAALGIGMCLRENMPRHRPIFRS